MQIITSPSPPDPNIVTISLENGQGHKAVLTNLGATLMQLHCPDRHGATADVVLGYDSPGAYLQDPCYFGCTVGRYANRIHKGKFTLDGKRYEMAINNPPNHLHGGNKGFNRVLWEFETQTSEKGVSATFRYCSPDGEEGYPGKLTAQTTYTLNRAGELRIDYEAETDRPTVVNLTNHSYFNLSGSPDAPVLNHQLQIRSAHITPLTHDFVPDQQMMPVAGTPFDFNKLKPIGQDLASGHPQTKLAGGYDHNFVVNPERKGLIEVAQATDPGSGRKLEVMTTQPGMQLYTPNFEQPILGKAGVQYAGRCAFCLETQHYPDSPNRPDFPSTVLRPGGRYLESVVYKMGVS